MSRDIAAFPWNLCNFCFSICDSFVNLSGFQDILLRGFRAVAEANGFADGYESFQYVITSLTNDYISFRAIMSCMYVRAISSLTLNLGLAYNHKVVTT